MESKSQSQKIYNQSALMSSYNYAKHWAKRTGLADAKRVDRALGYLMSDEAKEKWMDYSTTTQRCDCPDHQFRGQFCKHIISKMIEVKHDQIMEAEIWQYQKVA